MANRKVDIVAAISTVASSARAIAPRAASSAYQAGRSFARTRTGQRIVTGAAAGAAVGAALPLLSIATGALLGAGALVLIKAARDRD